MMVWHNVKLIYIIVPGTGSNSFWPGLKEKYGDPEEPTKGNITGAGGRTVSKQVGHPAWVAARNEKINHYAHLPAKYCKEFVDEQVWDTYEKIAFVRNPFDWVWTMHNKSGVHGSVGIDNSGKINHTLEKLTKTPYYWFTDDAGHVMIDTIYRTEDLDTEIFSKFGIKPRHSNPTRKKKYQLNQFEQALLRKIFEREFKHYET